MMIMEKPLHVMSKPINQQNHHLQFQVYVSKCSYIYPNSLAPVLRMLVICCKCL